MEWFSESLEIIGLITLNYLKYLSKISYNYRDTTTRKTTLLWVLSNNLFKRLRTMIEMSPIVDF